MIMDKYNEFADAVTVANTADAWYNLGSQIDLDVVRDIGNGTPVYLVITVGTEIITGGSAGTLQFRLVSDDSASISTTVPSIHSYSPIYVTDGTDANDAEMKAGQAPWVQALPIEGEQYEAFLGVQYSPGTVDTTAGAVNAFLTLDPYGYKAYPDGAH
jgi:Bbp16